jgi:hypothetical protein
VEGKVLTNLRCFSSNEKYKDIEPTALAPSVFKERSERFEYPTEDASVGNMMDNVATKKDLEELKEMISNLVNTRLFLLKSELERRMSSTMDRTEFSDERSSDEFLTSKIKQRKTLDTDELENFANKEVKVNTEFKKIKLQKGSLYFKLNNDMKDISSKTKRKLKDQEDAIEQLRKRCEKLEKSGRVHGKELETTEETDNKILTFCESIKSELNSFKNSTKKSQAETKQRLDNLEVNLKLIQSTTQDHLKQLKSFITKKGEEIALQMLKVSNYLRGSTQEVLLKLANYKISLSHTVNPSRSKAKLNNQVYKTETDGYQDSVPQDISHNTFYGEEHEFTQDKELPSIMKLEESIARSDVENIDEVRRMLMNNYTLSNANESKFNPDNTESRNGYEEDKALLNFIKGPTKDHFKETESNFLFNE